MHTPLDDLCAKIVEAASEAVIFADREGRIRLWNRGAELLFGYAAAEAEGPASRHHRSGAAAPRALGRLRSQHRNRPHEARRSRTDDALDAQNGARLYVDLSFGLVNDAQGAVLGAFAIGRDCTERYLAEANAKARLAELEAQRAQVPSRPAE